MHLGTNSPRFFFFLLIFFTLLINWLHWASLWSVIATSSSSAGAKEAVVAFVTNVSPWEDRVPQVWKSSDSLAKS